MKTEILHNGIVENIQDLMVSNESIIWEGQPRPKFSISMLEMGHYYDAMSGPTNTIGMVLALMIVGGFYFYNIGNYLGLLLSTLLGLIIIFLPDYIKHKRKINTRYFFSNKRVYFQLWRWGKISYHFIPLKEIRTLVTSTHSNGTGVIYLVVFHPKNINFSTYDFVASQRRHQPTFEMIENIEEVAEHLKQLVRNCR